MQGRHSNFPQAMDSFCTWARGTLACFSIQIDLLPWRAAFSKASLKKKKKKTIYSFTDRFIYQYIPGLGENKYSL